MVGDLDEAREKEARAKGRRIVRLTVATPLAIVVEADDVAHLRAEDETGAFGILAGHADFLTALAVSVLSWRDDRGAEYHIAVRGGMLEVRDGRTIAVATPAGDCQRRSPPARNRSACGVPAASE